MTGSWHELADEAARRDSNQLAAVWSDGTMATWPEAEEPVECMSMTKFVVGAALGLVVEVEDLDVPIATWIDEWRGDERGRLTLRHLATHTSGLEVVPSSAVYGAPSVERLVLSLEPVAPPGTFAYTNAAVHLLGIVVKRACGRDLAALASDRLFEPLGVERWDWQRDAEGFPLCMAGLWLSARDLAQVGALYLTDGRKGGRRVLSPEWVRATVPVAPGEVGLCCFADYEWLRRTGTHVEAGRRTGYGHTGDFGQHLTIQPDIGVVAVRTRTTFDYDDDAMWRDFPGHVRRCLSTGRPPSPDGLL